MPGTCHTPTGVESEFPVSASFPCLTCAPSPARCDVQDGLFGEYQYLLQHRTSPWLFSFAPSAQETQLYSNSVCLCLSDSKNQ